MNKYIRIMLGGALIVMTACQSAEPEPMESTPVEGRQLISVKVSEVKSRGGRELLSSEAGQSIENVLIILTDDNDEVVWRRNIGNWNSQDADIQLNSTVCPNGREAQIEIPKTEYRMLGGATYHAYALGYSDDSSYDLSEFTGLNVGDTYEGNGVIRLKDGIAAEEVFAGDCQIIGNAGGVEAELVLNRQVAGTFGYLSRIPYVKDAVGHVGRYLLLTVANGCNSLVLGNFDNSNASGDYQGACVVNGLGNNADYQVVYSINLSNWFRSIIEETDAEGKGTGIIKGGVNWKGDPNCYQNGSVFAGQFIIPTMKIEAPTLQLHLCYANDVATSMRVWQVTLPTDAAQLFEYSLSSFANNNWMSFSATDELNCYNILRNHLYAIGTKAQLSLPAEADEEIDNPEPINNKQELTVTVNHNWDAIYNMEVE